LLKGGWSIIIVVIQKPGKYGTRYMTPYDRASDMGVYTKYMTVYDGICQVVRIPDVVKFPDDFNKSSEIAS
jgi:hypothetical protein